MVETGSYSRGDQPRSVPDEIAQPYAAMVRQQRAHNLRQAGDAPGQPGSAPARTAGRVAIRPLAERVYVASAADLSELRKQQAAFKATTRAISRDNQWMALPALAPVAAVVGLGGAAFAASRLAPIALRPKPLAFKAPEPVQRGGDTWATQTGRRAHDELRARVEAKPRWEYEPRVRTKDGRELRPDVRTPARVRRQGEAPAPFQMELKPDTPTGRAAAARAIKKYGATGVKTRAIYYDPKAFK